MNDDLYRKLQQHLDRMPVPFPATESGVELRILKRLFTPEDASLVLALSMIPETVGVIHRRLRRSMDRQTLATRLEDLASRGLIQAMPTPRGPKYAKAPFVVGFYEGQVNRLTAELERDVLQYFDEALGAVLDKLRTPQMRTVPVNRVIPVPDRGVARYDDIAGIVRTSAGPFAAMNCICQQGKDLLGEPCRQTSDREHCLMLGPAATLMVERAHARFVSREEMLALLERADREGLVLQPQNTENPLFVCCCCGCCCALLAMAKKLPHPAAFMHSNYVARADADACDACETCVTRCQMGAVTMQSDAAVVEADRCIGCGLCVSTCPSGAMALAARPESHVPPKDTMRLYTQLFRERYGALGLATAVGRSVLGLKT